MTLTAKDRVLAVLNHEVPDRVPIVIGVSNATGIKMKTYREIKAIAGITHLQRVSSLLLKKS